MSDEAKNKTCEKCEEDGPLEDLGEIVLRRCRKCGSFTCVKNSFRDWVL